MTDIFLGIGLLVALVLLLTVLVVAARSVLLPQRPATLMVNGGTQIATKTGQKLLGVLNENGILIPSACAGAGTCGLCRIKVTQGGLSALPIEAARFTRSELRDGLHLACQVMLRGDMTVEVDADLLSAETFMCNVAKTRQLTPLIREVTLQMPDEVRPEIVAGSFVQVTAPPFTAPYDQFDIPNEFAPQWEPLRRLIATSAQDVTRAYSISNRPKDTAAGRLVLNIRLALPPPAVEEAPPGVVSSWLFSLKAGDQVPVSGPFGTFRVQPTRREMVLIGGGVGIAPLRAMIHEQLECLGTSRKMTFWYGARNQSDLPYADDMDALAARHANFNWTVAFSDPKPNDRGLRQTGMVHTVAFSNYLRDHPAPETCEYYLCGPPLMIRAVLAMLDDLGVEAESIFNDDFGV
ncbi:NADH:ubiquinone reductase (Na(+)-transporting) subunit F [uncultured Sulfitobacter sp.]|uniref:NADH:ubiquinone reductase (Na(+)-transporting) subunit F n=1 Tax=uncultured Sulfitobacter sp. TaxID=191468 RepID=UPI002606FB9E|nr:NADH:ubiquinone reductase (Na(+)-transporting) subunit F [uncultured Sulfitobacter sp.]